MHATNTIPSGDEAGNIARKQMPEGRRFSGDYAREMGRRGAQKRHGQAAGGSAHATLLAELQSDVIQALAAKARQGNAQAARELREWLREYGVQGDAEELEITSLEDMTPDQRAFARAYVERRIARASKRLQGLRQAAAAAQQGEPPASGTGTLATNSGTSAGGLRQ